MADIDFGQSDVPVDRLTRLCATMTDALTSDDEYRDTDKAVILIDDGERGGIVTHGYDSMSEAIVDLLNHVQAMLASMGTGMDIIMVPNTVEGAEPP